MLPAAVQKNIPPTRLHLTLPRQFPLLQPRSLQAPPVTGLMAVPETPGVLGGDGRSGARMAFKLLTGEPALRMHHGNNEVRPLPASGQCRHALVLYCPCCSATMLPHG